MKIVNCNNFFHLYFLSLLFITCQAARNPSSSSPDSKNIFKSTQLILISNTMKLLISSYLKLNLCLLNPRLLNLSTTCNLAQMAWQKPQISIMLNSHTDVIPVESQKWTHHPFGAHIDFDSNIYARGSQDVKCLGMQYLEAIRKLKDSGFEPSRTIYLSYVPDEEIGGRDGAEKLAESDAFKKMNVAFVLDEGVPSPDKKYQAYYADKSPMWLVIKATGAPGHGAKLYDNTAMENLMKSIESIWRFRASEFDMLKVGLKSTGEVISANFVFLKAGTQSPTGFFMNMQPSEAEAGIDLRVPPTVDQAVLKRQMLRNGPLLRAT